MKLLDGFRNQGTVLAAYEGLGECDAEVEQNCKCATTGRGHVRQLLYDNLRAGKAWKAPRTEEVAETNPSNVVPMDVDSLHRKGGMGEKGMGEG